MVAGPSHSTGSATSEVHLTSSPAAVRSKYRLRFSKGGDLRLVSHHDLMHVFERMLRRAALPVAQTQGFHPQPRMVFALSLALGIAGTREVLELELTERLEPDELHARLRAQAPPGLFILSVRFLIGKSSPLVRRAFYRLSLVTPEGEASPLVPAPATLAERCQVQFRQSHLWVQRSRPQPRRLDIRPYLNALNVVDTALELAVWVTPTGTARPEEFARLLGLEPWLDAGAYFERSDLEMMDEVTAPAPDIHCNFEETPLDKEHATHGPTPPLRPTSLVAGPLSFDS